MLPAMSANGPAPPKVPFYAVILGAMILGLVAGPWLGAYTAIFGEVGKVVINAIKAAATPLLFFAIVHAILKTEVNGKAALRMVGIATTNTTIALATGLLLSNVLRPGDHLTLVTDGAGSPSPYAGKKVDFLKTFVGYIPTNVLTPFVDNAVLSIIILALLFGFALRRVKRERPESHFVEDLVETLLRVMEVVLAWVIKLIPLAVFGVAAKTVAENGYAPLKGLAVYVVVGLVGLCLHITVTYQAWLLIAGLPLRRFWREAREPMVYAVGTNSSLATLPATLQALGRLKISKESSTLGACVGTNLNNDGIVLYEGMAVLFVAQASGIDLSLSDQILASITCIVAAMGVAGVPEAGFVSLALVLNTIGLPIDILPLLLAVDWVIARARSVTNVLSDMVLSILLERAKGPLAAGTGPP
ncbi:MAG: dicarboxylate/amino acid:cation symporter [Polyangiaceae bacterium]|jgi:Na+/H+-dicarboxylate symporter|nr:dicarboxylate/amino acid:cation symporter [Polyangiaceae bacterium]